MSSIQRGSSATGSLPVVSGDAPPAKAPEASSGKATEPATPAADGKAGADQGLSSPSVQAGKGDVMVKPKRQKSEDSGAADKADGDGGSESDGDGGGDDAGKPSQGGFLKRMLSRSSSSSRKGAAAEGGGGGDSPDAQDKTKVGKSEGGRGATRSSAETRTRRSDRADRGDAKKSQKGGGGKARPVEGRERTEDVEQVSVLVGQDEGGDPVEQALAAHKKIIGDDERKNAFTSTYHDNFDPSLEPPDIERLGSIQGAVHMVRLADHLQSDGLDRDAIIDAAARKLLGFTRPDQVKKMLGEMNAAPIKQVYPLEVMLRILDQKPDFWPKVSRGEVLSNRQTLLGGERILAGHEFRVKYPTDYKIKAFALLGGEQPGYEFAPHKNGVYRMIVDEPGTWTFALTAERKGQMVIDTFTVTVREPGKLGDAPTAAELDAED